MTGAGYDFDRFVAGRHKPSSVWPFGRRFVDSGLRRNDGKGLSGWQQPHSGPRHHADANRNNDLRSAGEPT